MTTRRLTDARAAAAILRRGGLVAFPTETVYGLGANGLDPDAVRRIFEAKGRPADNPLIVHVAEPADAGRVAVITALAAALMRRFWPGPLTLVLPAREVVPAAVRAGLPTVAVRCPDHPLARDLVRLAGVPVPAPSANLSGRPSPTSPEAVLDDLAGRIDAVLDGGPCRHGIESTVVDCTGAAPSLLRLGALPAEALGLAPVVDRRGRERSPGTRYRHYAPRVPVHLTGDLRAALAAHPGASVVCGADDARRLGLSGPAVHVLAPTAAGRAAELFATLRRLERLGRPIVVAAPPEAGLDAATLDRLRRAASPGREESGAPV